MSFSNTLLDAAVRIVTGVVTALAARGIERYIRRRAEKKSSNRPR